MIDVPEIQLEKCDGCGLCVDVCSSQLIMMRESVAVVIKTEGCNWCTLCEAVCATGAIRCPFEIIIE